MKILSQDMIDATRDLIAVASADLIAARRIVAGAYGSHSVSRDLAAALADARNALLDVALTKLPAKEKSPKLKRMEGMARKGGARRTSLRERLDAACVAGALCGVGVYGILGNGKGKGGTRE